MSQKKYTLCPPGPKSFNGLSILLIDNYDSFTFNLFQYLTIINNDCEPTVIYNDDWDQWNLIISQQRFPFDAVVISPGPGHPSTPRDFGICKDFLTRFKERNDVPILGICLGFQGIVIEFGGEVVKAPEPFHGRFSTLDITYSDSKLFKNVSNKSEVIRYHSLIARFPNGIPDDLVVTSVVQNTNNATTEQMESDRIIMSMEHRNHPLFGLQFHPESIGTNCGPLLIQNFLRIARETKMRFDNQETLELLPVLTDPMIIDSRERNLRIGATNEEPFTCMKEEKFTCMKVSCLKLESRRVSLLHCENEDVTGNEYSIMKHRFISFVPIVFEKLFGDSQTAMWLDANEQPLVNVDSRRRGNEEKSGSRNSIFNDASIVSTLKNRSIMADLEGSLSHIFESWEINKVKQLFPVFSEQTYKGRTPWATRNIDTDIFTILKERLKQLQDFEQSRIVTNPQLTGFLEISPSTLSPNDLQSDGIHADVKFTGGFIGYFSYECKYDAVKHLLTRQSKTKQLMNTTQTQNEVNNGIHQGITYDDVSYHCSDISMDRIYELIGYPNHILNDQFVPISWWGFIDRFIEIEPKTLSITVSCLIPKRFEGLSCDGLFQTQNSTMSLLDKILQQIASNEEIDYVIAENTRWLEQTVATINTLWNTNINSNNHGGFPSGMSRSTSRSSSPSCGDSTVDSLSPTQDQESWKKSEQISPTKSNRIQINARMVPKQETILRLKPDRPKSKYVENIQQALQEIRAGESYQLCLTNHIETFHKCPKENNLNQSLSKYLILRNQNPSIFSAYIRHSSMMSDAIESSHVSNFSVLCSSPESFLQIARTPILNGEVYPEFYVFSSPIKGTRKRDLTDLVNDLALRTELERSEKDRAENLMILDLVRNDLGRVCIPGTVHVPTYLSVVTFARIHHMVSTAAGKLNYPKFDAIDCITSSFPGGSMTGAPKLRALQKLHTLENRIPRGVYSGCLGFLSLNGTVSLNIVIRTIVQSPEKISVGAGGGIVFLSDPGDEYDEMMIKASTTIDGMGYEFEA